MAAPASPDDFSGFAPSPDPEAETAASPSSSSHSSEPAPAVDARAFAAVLRENPRLVREPDCHVRPLACLGHSVALAQAFANVSPISLDDACRLVATYLAAVVGV